MAMRASPSILCHAGVDTPQDWGEKVMDSASSLLAMMKHRRAAQWNTEELPNGRHPDSRASKSPNEHANAPESMEPVTLRERLVFRANVPIDADSLLFLHQSYKDAEALINRALVSYEDSRQMEVDIFGETILSSPDEDGILLRCALREKHEARLKSQCILSDVTYAGVRQVDLLEQFWNAHGVPNRCEFYCLRLATGHSIEHLRGWYSTFHTKKSKDIKQRQWMMCELR
ncbi:MAG: hypothetical protein Q9186_002391 [Xanthomendoza sp. 1 TL-2023]